jgi:hypothetical protein
VCVLVCVLVCVCVSEVSVYVCVICMCLPTYLPLIIYNQTLFSITLIIEDLLSVSSHYSVSSIH